MYLNYFEMQIQVNAKPLQCHNSFSFMKVDFIQKLGHWNVVLDALMGRILSHEYHSNLVTNATGEKHL